MPVRPRVRYCMRSLPRLRLGPGAPAMPYPSTEAERSSGTIRNALPDMQPEEGRAGEDGTGRNRPERDRPRAMSVGYRVMLNGFWTGISGGLSLPIFGGGRQRCPDLLGQPGPTMSETDAAPARAESAAPR